MIIIVIKRQERKNNRRSAMDRGTYAAVGWLFAGLKENWSDFTKWSS